MSCSARNVLVELNRRVAPPAREKAPERFREYVDTLFQQQRAVLQSKHDRKAVLCTRRAGKSKLIPGLLFDAAEKHPGTVVYYIHPDGGTRAWETVMGPDINLQAINEKYSLGYRFNAVMRKLTNPRTGTEIRIRGADDAREVRKYRGDKVSRVVGDEAQNFVGDLLEKLIEEDLGPALADVGGDAFLLGTPGPVCVGYWHALTRNEDAAALAERRRDWEVHSWSALDNPHVADNVGRLVAAKVAALHEGVTAADVQRMLATPTGRAKAEALAESLPALVREWFGRWVRDANARFYAFNEALNLYDGTLPPGHAWYYVLGGDLGTGDAYAHHVWAVANTCDTVYEVESYSEPGLHAGQWREHFAAAQRRWRPVASVLDEGGLGKGVADEWRDTYALDVQPAEKTEKYAAVATLNAELREGRVKVLASRAPSRPETPAGATAAEWASLHKDPKVEAGKPPREHPAHPNHASDAALYAHRKALALAGRETQPDEKLLWDEKRRQEEERLARARKRVQQRQDVLGEDESWW